MTGMLLEDIHYFIRAVEKNCISFISIYFILICVWFTWQGFVSGAASGVATLRRIQQLPRVK